MRDAGTCDTRCRYGRAGADHDRAVGFGAAVAERCELGDIDKRVGLCQPELHERKEAVPASQHLAVTGTTECRDRFLDRRGGLIAEGVRDHRFPSPLDFRVARQLFSGVRGMSRCLIPTGETASITALTTAG